MAGILRSDPFQLGLQLAVFKHFLDNVRATNELALDIELRNGRPVRILLDPVMYGTVSQHVNGCKTNFALLQDLRSQTGETTLREIR